MALFWFKIFFFFFPLCLHMQRLELRHHVPHELSYNLRTPILNHLKFGWPRIILINFDCNRGTIWSLSYFHYVEAKFFLYFLQKVATSTIHVVKLIKELLFSIIKPYDGFWKYHLFFINIKYKFLQMEGDWL